MKRTLCFVFVLVLLVHSFSVAAQSNVRNFLRGAISYVVLKQPFNQLNNESWKSYPYKTAYSYSSIQPGFYGTQSQFQFQRYYSPLTIESISLPQINYTPTAFRTNPSILSYSPITRPLLIIPPLARVSFSPPVSFPARTPQKEELQYLDFLSLKIESMSFDQPFEKPDTVFQLKSISDILFGEGRSGSDN